MPWIRPFFVRFGRSLSLGFTVYPVRGVGWRGVMILKEIEAKIDVNRFGALVGRVVGRGIALSR